MTCTCLHCGVPVDGYMAFPTGSIFEGFEVPVCQPCADRALAGYEKMKVAEAELEAQGVHPRIASRILSRRVWAGDFD